MVFQDENAYLIHLLYCAIHDIVPQNVPAEISLEKVFEIGKTHEVANIAYAAIKKISEQVPDALLTQWREFYYLAVKRDLAQNKARTEILDALHTHGIYTFEVQGTVVKQYYPQRHLRMMSDLDFIIPEEKLGEAEEVMREIGYQTNNPNGIEIDAEKDLVAVELHTEFFDTKSVTRAALNHPYSYAVCGENYAASVSDTVFYLFHLLHTIKHCGQKGSGLRRVIDLYYLEMALRDRVDYGYIDGVLKKYGFYATKMELLAVKDHWFCGIKPEMDLSKLERDILESGNHGIEDHFWRNKFARERAEGKHFVKLRYLISNAFPSKEAIYRAYPFCEKHHLPIVLCWIHRWNCCLFNVKKWKKIKPILKAKKE